MSNTHQERWTRVKGRLRAEVGEDIFSSWFARMELEGVDSDTVRLSVPTRFLKSWIQSHYAERVLACWQGEEPLVRRIDLSVRSAGVRPAAMAIRAAGAVAAVTVRAEPSAGPIAINGHSGPVGAGPIGMPATSSAGQDAVGGSPLDPRLTFETFVVGRANSLAHAAAKQVAAARRGDTVMFNPLYVHAAVGLGKTHLLQAIAWAGNAGGERRVLYLTAEKFVYGFVSSLRTQTTLAFKEVLRATDVLLIDDLQFLQGKSTFAEFSHTLNAMIDAGRQVVVAADRPPLDLENLDDRVRSRLAGGLVVEMGSFGEDLRLEILQSRVACARTHHADFDVPAPVLSFIAKSVTHNGRDLEGALNRLLAHSKLTGQPITMELAEREIRDLVRPQEPRKVKIEEIQRIVARRYNVSRGDLLSSRRTANVVRPRQIAMYLAKTLTLRSLPEIGKRFGDHRVQVVLHEADRLDAAGHEELAVACLHRMTRGHDRREARGAEPVHRHAGYLVREAGEERGHPRFAGVLPRDERHEGGAGDGHDLDPPFPTEERRQLDARDELRREEVRAHEEDRELAAREGVVDLRPPRRARADARVVPVRDATLALLRAQVDLEPLEPAAILVAVADEDASDDRPPGARMVVPAPTLTPARTRHRSAPRRSRRRNSATTRRARIRPNVPLVSMTVLQVGPVLKARTAWAVSSA